MNKEVIFTSMILNNHPMKIVSRKNKMVHPDLVGCLDAPSYMPAGSMRVSLRTADYSFAGPSIVVRGIDASTVEQWALKAQTCIDNVSKDLS